MIAHAANQGQERSARRSRLAQQLRRNGLQIGIIGVLVGLWLFFIIRAPDTFLKGDIYRALMTSIPYYGVVALPLTLVVIAGEMDLSFISIMAVGMVAFVKVFEATGSLGIGFAACLTAGFLVGLINGLIVVKIGIPSLIATIGTQFFWRGVVYVVTNGQGESLVTMKETVLRKVMVSKINDYLPMQMVWFVLIAIAVWFLLNRHKFGAHLYLIGDNENSARLMGVNVDRTRILVFAVVGVAAALGGFIQSTDVWYFWPNLGEGYLMKTLAPVFLGGTSVFGGTGTILGTFIGCFIIGAIEPGIVAIGWTGYLTQLIYGLIITLSVAMHTILKRRIG